MHEPERPSTLIRELSIHAALTAQIEIMVQTAPNATIEEASGILKDRLSQAFTTDWRNTSIAEWRDDCEGYARRLAPPWE